ncbi:MAG: ATP-binding protein, partial [Planctomycetota bacterium]
ADQPASAPARPPVPRRSIWDGVPPDALGIGFVIVVLAGFAAGCLLAQAQWRADARRAAQVGADQTAAALARAVMVAAGAGDEAAGALARELGRVPGLRSARWVQADGVAALTWPPGGVPAVAQEDEPPLAARVDLRTPAGQPAGVLEIQCSPPEPGTYDLALLGAWGLAACLTLLAFLVFHRRLRRHLRPVAAVERNLRTYADGVEQELVTLTLSDSLGSVARGWNRLIQQVTEAQAQLSAEDGTGATCDVLARFEGAVFRRILDRLPYGVLSVGENETVSYANDSAAALLGRKSAELVGAPVGTAIENPAVLQAVAGARARSGVGLSIDHTRPDAESETTLRFRVLSVSDRLRGGEVLITVEDISQLKEGQRARDNFLYHVTHELRTPLTNIHAYAETLTQPGFDDEQTRKECYNVLISETKRLSRLVEDILSISQLEVGTALLDIGEVDLVRLLRQMVQDHLGHADEKKIDLTLGLPPKAPKVRGDKQRLAVLLNNLIGNALKYTPEGGKVQVNLELAEQTVRIAVKDTGIGIAPDDQPHVFDKFYRSADEQVQVIPGTGLGLALAREVARLHGGDIHLESTPGAGSTFTVELPVGAGEPVEVATR